MLSWRGRKPASKRHARNVRRLASSASRCSLVPQMQRDNRFACSLQQLGQRGYLLCAHLDSRHHNIGLCAAASDIEQTCRGTKVQAYGRHTHIKELHTGML